MATEFLFIVSELLNKISGVLAYRTKLEIVKDWNAL
jgi:hypothetical protein